MPIGYDTEGAEFIENASTLIPSGMEGFKKALPILILFMLFAKR